MPQNRDHSDTSKRTLPSHASPTDTNPVRSSHISTQSQQDSDTRQPLHVTLLERRYEAV